MRVIEAEELRAAGLGHAAILSAEQARPFLRGEAPEHASVLVALLPCFAGREAGNLSLYARGRDYHSVARELLARAAERLALPGQAFADVSPFAEVSLAAHAGLGGMAENGLLLSKELGSFCFIAEWVTPAELMPLAGGLTPACTHCGACEAACPTGALRGGRVERELCLSELTQRRRVTPEQLSLIAGASLAWGCDTCQLACPANREPPLAELEGFTRNLIHTLQLRQLAGMSDALFRAVYADRAFSWRGIAPLRRNLAAQETKADSGI